MKYILTLLLVCSTLFSFAQIKITFADSPVLGDVEISSRDTVPFAPSISPGTAGASQTWDFSALVEVVRDTTWHVNPSSTPRGSSFPNSNLAVTQDNEGYLYVNNSPNSYRVEGLAGDPLGTGIPLTLTFAPAYDQYRYDVEFGGSFTGNYAFDETVQASSIPPNIIAQLPIPVGVSLEAVRVRFESNFTDEIDGWGTVITPLGSYDAIRQKRVETTRTRVDVDVIVGGFIPQTINVLDDPGVTTTYNWLSNQIPTPLIAMTFDTSGAINAVSYNRTPPPPAPTASFTWSNPSGGLVEFTNTSSSTAALFSWDFGDGSPLDDTRDPNKVYVNNQKYYVCLTASNASGSDTFCDSVDVNKITGTNNAPLARRDFRSINQPNSVTIDLLANDVDPDLDNISFISNAMPSNGMLTNNGGGSITYAPNAAFVGVDSFSYVIQDDGVPFIQSTGWAVIEVKPEIVPTIASFTVDSTGCNELAFTNTSSNGVGIASWDYGDGSNIDFGDNVTHAYADSGTYNVCVSVFDNFNNIVTDCDSVEALCRTNTPIDTTSINERQLEALTFFPNPVTSSLTINWKASESNPTEAIFYDMSGRAVMTQAIKEEGIARVSVEELATGSYIVQLISAKGNVIGVAKVQVQH